MSSGRKHVWSRPTGRSCRQHGFSAVEDGDRASGFANGDGQLQERGAKDFNVVAYSPARGNAAASRFETNLLVPLDHTAAAAKSSIHRVIGVTVTMCTSDSDIELAQAFCSHRIPLEATVMMVSGRRTFALS